jgi:predicted MFS family arabinose efflux permease
MLTAFTVGATGAFLLSLVRPAGRRAGGIAVAGIVVQGAVLAGLGVTGTLWPALAGYVLLGAVGAQVSLITVSLIQRRTPADVRGRVMSIMSLLVFASAPLGNLTIGLMVEHLGVTTTMLVQAALSAAAAGAFLSVAGLRRARLD